MALTLAEGLVDALTEYIDTNIAAKLTALNAEYPDSIVLAAPVETYGSLKSIDLVPAYPILFVAATEQQIKPRSTYGPTEYEVTVTPRVAVGIVVVDSDEETLQKRVYRYARALTELMLSGSGARDIDGWNLGTGEDWSINFVTAPFTEETDNSFIGEATVEARANKVEWTT